MKFSIKAFFSKFDQIRWRIKTVKLFSQSSIIDVGQSSKYASKTGIFS